MEYQIIRTSGTDQALEPLVRHAISLGWRPQGGVCVFVTLELDQTMGKQYQVVHQWQPMVKDSESEDMSHAMQELTFRELWLMERAWDMARSVTHGQRWGDMRQWLDNRIAANGATVEQGLFLNAPKS